MNNLNKLMILILFTVSQLSYGIPYKIQNDEMILGTPNATNKIIEFNNNTGSANPKIRLNQGTTQLEFTNDGVNYAPFGSGGGGGGGINALQSSNFNFASGTTDWTASGGSFTTDATLPQGGLRATFDASASGQTLQSALIDVADYGDAFKGKKCQVQIPNYTYTGNDGDYELKVLDGNGTEILVLDLSNTSGNAFNAFQTFDCPDPSEVSANDRSFRISIESTTDGGDLKLNEVFLGQGRNEVHWGDASIVGTLTYAGATACLWETTSGTIGSFSADTDCSAPTVTGKAIAPVTRVPAVTFPYLAPGQYKLTLNGIMQAGASSSGTQDCDFELYDGTTRAARVNLNSPVNTGVQNSNVLVGIFHYASAQVNKTFQIRSARNGGNVTCSVPANTSTRDLTFILEYLPHSPTEGHTYETSGWFFEGNIGGDTADLGLSDVTTYKGIESPNFDLQIYTSKGSAPGKILCSSTNAPSGLTCSSGNESVGVAVDVPSAGTYRACFNPSWNAAIGNASNVGNADITLDVVETGLANQTVSQHAGVYDHRRVTVNVANTQISTRQSGDVCGYLKFSSAGEKAIRLFYTTDLGGTVLDNFILANRLLGNASIRVRIDKWNESMPTPVFNDLINALALRTQSAATNMVMASARIAMNSGTPTLVYEEGDWIASLVDTGVGVVSVNFQVGFFSATPVCTCTGNDDNAPRMCQIGTTTPTASGTVFSLISDGAGTVTDDGTFNIVCRGPK